MHFYDFNIGDYAKKTQHLSNEEDLAYRRALDMYYDTEQPLPITHGLATLSRRLRVSEIALKNVIDEFFPGGKNKHADEKIAAYYAYLAKQKENGKRGGRPKNQQVTDNEKPTANPLVSQNNPVPSQPLTTKPLTTNQKLIKEKEIAIKPDGVDDAVFNDFLKLRKAKRAPLTETALSGITKEATKAGITLQTALEICCKRGWQSFDAGWDWKPKSDTPQPKKQKML